MFVRLFNLLFWLVLSACTSFAQPSDTASFATSAADSSSHFNVLASKTIDSLSALPAALRTETDVPADPILAQRYDARYITLRSFDAEALARLRAQKEFEYDRPPPPPSLWDRMRQWLDEYLFRHIFRSEFSRWVDYLLIGSSVLLLLYLILYLTQTNLRSIFYSSTVLHPVTFASEVHLDADALQALIDEAIVQQDYRSAVRYLFLRALNALAAKGLIVWRIDKTNRDYVQELAQNELRTRFSELVRLFEYVWYGEFALTKQDFEVAKRAFDTFTLQLPEQ